MATENTEVCGCSRVLRPSITQLLPQGGKATVELTLNGTILSAAVNGSSADIDLSSLVPATTADRFVREGRFDEASKSLILVTATANGEEQEVTVAMAQVFDAITTAVTTAIDQSDFGARLTALEEKIASYGELQEVRNFGDEVVFKAFGVASTSNNNP